MKKIFFCLSVLCLALLYSNELKASCPLGYTSSGFPLVVGTAPNECIYNVQYCYKCKVTGFDPSYFMISEIIPSPGCNKSFAEIQAALNAYITTMLTFESFANLCDGSAPCGETTASYQFMIPSCWQIKKEANGHYRYEACSSDDAFCNIIQLFCTDSNGKKVLIPLAGTPYIQNGPPNCLGFPVILPSQVSPGTTSDCFPNTEPCGN